jgi:hypothetical protein
MAADEQPHEHAIDHVPLPNDCLANLAPDRWNPSGRFAYGGVYVRRVSAHNLRRIIGGGTRFAIINCFKLPRWFANLKISPVENII